MDPRAIALIQEAEQQWQVECARFAQEENTLFGLDFLAQWQGVAAQKAQMQLQKIKQLTQASLLAAQQNQAQLQRAERELQLLLAQETLP